MVAGTDQTTAYEALMSPIGEYAAAATYQAIIDKYGAVEPYVMILSAEERHISALVRQLDRLGVDVPANPYLGKVVAPTDLVTAANEEANIEVLNAAMYDSLISQSSDANLIRVFTNLQRASTDSHLPLFLAAAENGGTLTVEQMMDLQHG
jgi:ribosome-interacting GTPase 1